MPIVGGLQPPSAEDEEQEKLESREGIVVVLEQATLEVGKVGKSMVLLNCDDHANFLARHDKSPADYRPDICHQALMSILDSPLNKAGRISAIYVHTQKNVLFEVSPQVRLPRTFRRFCGLMAQLLQKLSIRSSNGPDKLLRVVKGPVTRLLPADCKRIGFSAHADRTLSPTALAKEFPRGEKTVLVVGAMAHGSIDVTYTDETLCVSNYPLSAACALARLLGAVEAEWGVV
ncbi:unnamed protein product [Pedinophyceae sp. YPF-701]|nr:unnamed protein product [Pedinophyceae sp. YPF-701]